MLQHRLGDGGGRRVYKPWSEYGSNTFMDSFTQQLSYDVLYSHLLPHLNYPDLVALMRTCKFLYHTISRHDHYFQSIYFNLFERDLALKEPSPLERWESRVAIRMNAEILTGTTIQSKTVNPEILGNGKDMMMHGDYLVRQTYENTVQLYSFETKEWTNFDFKIAHMWNNRNVYTIDNQGNIYEIDCALKQAKLYYRWDQKRHPIKKITTLDNLVLAHAEGLGIVAFSEDFVSSPKATSHWVIPETRAGIRSMTATHNYLFYADTNGKVWKMSFLDDEFGDAEPTGLENIERLSSNGGHNLVAFTDEKYILVNDDSMVIPPSQPEGCVQVIWNDNIGAVLSKDGEVFDFDGRKLHDRVARLSLGSDRFAMIALA